MGLGKGLIGCTRAKMGHSCPGTLANMTGPIGEVTNLVTLLAGATFGASKLWKDPKIPPKKSPLEELASGLQEVLGGLSALQGAVEGLRDRLDRQQETLQKQQELLQVMQLEDGGVKEIKQEIQSIKAIVIGRLAKPLDGKGDEKETVEEHEEEDEMADDMREADETDDDAVTETEDNQNEADSESWEGLSAENEEEEEGLNQDEAIKEENEEVVKEEEEDVVKETEAPARVPELIFQDGQWVEASNA